MPRCFKPCRQRCSRLLKNRSSGNRRLVPTGRTHKTTPGLPPRLSCDSTCRTPETVWPAQALQVRGACYIVMKPVDELTIGARIVTSSNQLGRLRCNAIRLFHHYILGQEELTVYPLWAKTASRMSLSGSCSANSSAVLGLTSAATLPTVVTASYCSVSSGRSSAQVSAASASRRPQR